jgi:serine protease Do
MILQNMRKRGKNEILSTDSLRRNIKMIRHKYNYLYFILGVVFLFVLTAILPSAVVAEIAKDKNTSLDLRTAIARVAKENIPSVVHVEVTQRQEMPVYQLPFENDPFFRYFFDVPNMPKKYQRELKGLGTGMIMDSKGNILTNNHVVGNATEINVLLSNGNRYKAKLVGADPKTDLAVIKIEAGEPLTHVNFGDSDRMDVGDWVVAIGHPRGLDQTVTQGIISAKHRRGITDPNSYQDFLQTDAAINPGNSGGPLINLNGEVIGVNSVIVSQSGGFEGIGFAIPSNMAQHIASELITHGKVERGWLGVSIQDLTPELAGSFGLKSTKGALIADVSKNGPADKAGLKRGDIIIAFDGKEIHDAGILRNEVATTSAGRTVNITIVRKGDRKEFSVRIGSLESATKLLSKSIRNRLGAGVRNLNSKEIRKYNLNPNQGIAINWLDPKGPLGEAGFEKGDIILEVNGKSMEDIADFVDVVGTLQSNQKVVILALDHRSGRTAYVQVVVQ